MPVILFALVSELGGWPDLEYAHGIFLSIPVDIHKGEDEVHRESVLVASANICSSERWTGN